MEKYLFEEEEFEDDSIYKFGNQIENKFKENSRPLVSYSFIDLADTQYGFNQDCFDFKDVQKYFSQLKKLSKLTLKQCVDELGNDDHFKIDPSPKGKIKSLIERIANKSLSPTTMPPVGHFALYTSQDGSDRKSNIKSPRIFFMLIAGTMYITFYDPYHEIHPKKP